MTTATTSFSGRRSSRCRLGSSSASNSSAAASARKNAALRATPKGQRDDDERGDRQRLDPGDRKQRRELQRPRVQCDSLSNKSLAWT